MDLDTNVNGRAQSNGVPGVDVDLRATQRGERTGGAGVNADVPARGNGQGTPGMDVDTRASGAGPAAAGIGRAGMRPPIQDRN